MGEVIVTINGENVTEQMLDSAVGRYIVQLEEDETAEFEPSKDNLKYIKAEVLNYLIERVLVLQKAREEGLEVSDEAVQRNIEAIRSNFETETDWQNNLDALHVSNEKLFEEIRKDMIIEKYMNQLYQKKIEFSEEKLRTYFDANEKNMKEPDLFSFYEIYSTKPEKVKLIYQAMKLDMDVSKLQDELSQIGVDFYNHADVAAHQLPEPLLNVLSDLQEGEIASMPAPDSGIMIYKLLKKVVGRRLLYDEIKEKLAEHLIQTAKKDVTQQFISEAMEKAAIEYRDMSYIQKK